MTGKKAIIYSLICASLVLSVLLITARPASAPLSRPAVSPSKIEISQPEVKSALEAALPTTTIIFGGDVMLSRNVGQKMEKYKDWSWPFKNISGLMSSAELTVINLESPITASGSHLVKTGSFSFNADPKAIAGLKSAGVDIVSLANNHILNQGAKGISDTRRTLADNQIAFAGAGLNESAAREPVIKEINQIKFGFLSYAYPDDSSVATTKTPGLANMDIKKMADDISKLKTQADVIIVLMHAGTEYKNSPNLQQQNFARAAIDAGADLVVGHHPHWVQSVEVYKNKPILYSLGNLVFDQMWSIETQEGTLAQVEWTGKSITDIKIIPIRIKDYGQAEVATSTAEINSILRRMGLKSPLIKLP